MSRSILNAKAAAIKNGKPMPPAPRKTVTRSSADEKIKTIVDKVKDFSIPARRDLLEALGAGSEYFTCYLCSKVKPRSEFYKSTDPMVNSGVTRICKECCSQIAMPFIKGTREPSLPTRETMKMSCMYSDTPFLNKVWEMSKQIVLDKNTTRPTNSVAAAYRKQIQLITYQGMTYKDSDMFSLTARENEANLLFNNAENEDKSIEMLEQFEKNKQDVTRLIGYDPFSAESREDQPQLYSDLLGMLDAGEEGNSDMVKISAAISIVRSFLQLKNLDDMLAKITKDNEGFIGNVTTIKLIQESKQKITTTISTLAEDNCLTLKYNKNQTKGENTWTGKVLKLKEMNLREAEVNSYDAETSTGLRQVADISNASIMHQLAFDENDYTHMISEQRLLLDKYTRDMKKSQEQARILLRENIDLKALLDENEILYDIPSSRQIARDNIVDHEEEPEENGDANE